MKIAITGSIAYDYIMTYPGEFAEMLRLDGLNKISVSFLVDEMTKHPGGVAPNIAYTLALLGERPVLVGTAGRDFTEYRSFLDAAGVDTSGTRVHADLFTASFFVSTDRLNNQIASFYTGAMARARELTLNDAVPGRIDLALISPNDPEAMSNYADECRASAIPFIYDPGQQVARMSGEDLAHGLEGARVLIVNDVEYEGLVRKTGLTHDALMKHAETVIVTRGEQGADIYAQDTTYHIPIVPADHIEDPTGVGDAFRSGFLKGLASGWPLDICGRVGALAATYVLENRGSQAHHFTISEFVARFRQHFDDRGLLDQMLENAGAKTPS
jgi:adenosine kinase